MKATNKKKLYVKEAVDEDTSKYIDYSKPLNFKHLLQANNAKQKRSRRKADKE